MLASIFRLLGTTALIAAFLLDRSYGEPIPVRYGQGSSHGFLALKTLDGATIATGESTQVVHGNRVTSRLIFRFKDGSIDDDTTVFTQSRVFHLVSDHRIQHGPSFSQTNRLSDRWSDWEPDVPS